MLLLLLLSVLSFAHTLSNVSYINGGSPQPLYTLNRGRRDGVEQSSQRATSQLARAAPQQPAPMGVVMVISCTDGWNIFPFFPSNIIRTDFSRQKVSGIERRCVGREMMGKTRPQGKAERSRWRSPPQVNPDARDAATLPAEKRGRGGYHGPYSP